ncbi:MAG: aminoacyl-tRNA hydrolase [Armatimonadia bacterium]|nr:aminoacyl-tRNA hydrolase [Armatimonadia bacterium]
MVRALAEAHDISISNIPARGPAVTGTGHFGEEPVVLAIPLTMMNNSGVAVIRVCRLYEIELENLIVVVDDLNLELGQLRLRRSGSTGGHNGLKSINEKLETKDYPRLRIGIGNPPGGMDARDWVLSEFTADEREVADEAVERARDCVEMAVTEGIEAAMNEFNS